MLCHVADPTAAARGIGNHRTGTSSLGLESQCPRRLPSSDWWIPGLPETPSHLETGGRHPPHAGSGLT